MHVDRVVQRGFICGGNGLLLGRYSYAPAWLLCRHPLAGGPRGRSNRSPDLQDSRWRFSGATVHERLMCQTPGMPAARRFLAVVGTVAVLSGCAPPVHPTDTAQADAVMAIVRDTMTHAHLKAAIVRVTIDGKEVVTQALGESMTGVP